jgi:hypothetical protein
MPMSTEDRDARIATLEQELEGARSFCFEHERRIAQLEFRLEESAAVIRAMAKWGREHPRCDLPDSAAGG